MSSSCHLSLSPGLLGALGHSWRRLPVIFSTLSGKRKGEDCDHPSRLLLQTRNLNGSLVKSWLYEEVGTHL